MASIKITVPSTEGYYKTDGELQIAVSSDPEDSVAYGTHRLSPGNARKLAKSLVMAAELAEIEFQYPAPKATPAQTIADLASEPNTALALLQRD